METNKVIQELQQSFLGTGEVKGASFIQRAKTSTHYIFERVQEGVSHFEVFERKHTAVCLNFANREYSDTLFKETYPKSKDFGIWAWCCNDLDKANTYIYEYIYNNKKK